LNPFIKKNVSVWQLEAEGLAGREVNAEEKWRTLMYHGGASTARAGPIETCEDGALMDLH
jgi:hypothetical protein